MEQVSNIELLATLTGEKNLEKVKKLLSYGGSNMQRLKPLVNITMEEIVEYAELSKNQAKRIVASIELSKRISCEPKEKKINISQPEDVATLFMEGIRHEKQEHFYTLLLNVKNEIIDKEMISKGNINSSIVDPKDVFINAIKKGAASVILIHNHPSGNSEPSEADIKITDRLTKAGDILDIKVIDHIIIGDREYTSFKQRNLIKDISHTRSSIHEKKHTRGDAR